MQDNYASIMLIVKYITKAMNEYMNKSKRDATFNNKIAGSIIFE